MLVSGIGDPNYFVYTAKQLGYNILGHESFPDHFSYKNLGDGQIATSVIFTLVDGITVGPKGNIYISHRSQNKIRKIDKNGIVSTIAGNGHAKFSGDGGPAVNSSLNFPAGLAFDSKGNLFIVWRYVIWRKVIL
mgnify:CR=1 FL=1